jgi:hypothetical protein
MVSSVTHGDGDANAEGVRVQLAAELALEAAEGVVMNRAGAIVRKKHPVIQRCKSCES